ncbi:universal stress protein [Ktedonobacter robiniae]|uniref:Universal stress protein UspA n=1 Tax=Ktedonobacter robiniae TaxID=2778365 RepID=A0ABQ3UH41_9CHLR|nr:universal stress protein [Ktedonobacter robiniae]GHO52031.1 universal stress protein UspA [Ktedonobacter robiniae]
MFKRILIPLDGSKRAEEALSMGAYLARMTGASLLLVKVIAPELLYTGLYPTVPSYVAEQVHTTYLAEAETYLKHVIRILKLEDISVSTEVIIGIPDATIVQIAGERQADLIVMRSQGQTGVARWFFGSVAQYVLRHSLVPVLVMRDGCSPLMLRPAQPFHVPRILVPLDGSPQAETALEPAAEMACLLAGSEQGQIHLTCAVRSVTARDHFTIAQEEQQNKAVQAEAEAYLAAIATRLRAGEFASSALKTSYSVVTYTREEEIWKRIFRESECIGDVPGYAGYDLIAMSTHGRTGLQHLLHGSITEHVFDSTVVPLLIVHTHTIPKEEIPSSDERAYLTMYHAPDGRGEKQSNFSSKS